MDAVSTVEVAAGAPAGTDLPDSPLTRIARERVGQGWSLRADPAWCYVQPPSYAPREQGWKLHVSATLGSAPEVLSRALDVLLPADWPGGGSICDVSGE